MAKSIEMAKPYNRKIEQLKHRIRPNKHNFVHFYVLKSEYSLQSS